MEQSPNYLRPPQPERRGLSKRPMYMLIAAIIILLVALFYAMDHNEKRRKKQAEDERKTVVDEQAIAMPDGPGLAIKPPEKSERVILSEKEIKPRRPVVVQTIDRSNEELQVERKRKEQLYLNALAAPLVTQKNETPERQENLNTRQGGTTLPAMIQPAVNAQIPDQSGEYNPAADKDKEGFFKRADIDREGWLSRYTRESGRQFEVKTGTVIPAVLISGINSDLPGVMIAQISQNVYDTATGSFLLFPQGAKLYGVYDSRVVYGQERVLIAWNRVIFPDGTSVTLGSMPGADMSGYAGFHDKVNNHYLRVFGGAFLMSAILGTTAYVADSVDNNGYNSDNPSFQDEMITALASQMGQAAMRLLERNLNIKPTLEIRPGYQFNVICTKDVAFREPYRQT